MYLPIISLNRSQNVRMGLGSPDKLGENKQGGNSLFHALHVNLNVGTVRRDLQRHSAIGAYEVVGPVTAKWSDLFVAAGVTVTAGTSDVSVPAFSLQSRLFTDQAALAVAGGTVSTPALTSGDIFYLIQVDNAGNLVAVPGGASNGAPTYEVDTVTVSSGTATGTLSWTFGGYNYSCAFTAAETAAGLATAIAGASSTNGGPTMAQLGAVAGTNVVGTGGALGTAAVTITFSGAMEGAVTNQAITTSAGTASFVSTTAGSNGATRPAFDGDSLPLNYVFVAENSTAPVVGASLVFTS